MDDRIKTALENGSDNALKNIIDNILVIDEQARTLTKQANDEREKKLSLLDAQKQEIEDSAMAEAKEKVEKFRAAQNKKNETLLNNSLKNEKEAMGSLNSQAEKFSDKWADDIFKAVIAD